MINRRQILTASAAGAAALILPGLVGAQDFPTVQEVLFDPEIPALGNPKGDVTIAEFFDYQCPYCKKGHPELMKVVKTDGNVRLIMKDWPIFGETSVYASSLVLAAKASGKYSEALHALMATEGRLTNEQVDGALEKAGLDPKAMEAAFKKDSKRVDGILARNMDQANAFGFGGTPSFIVGTKIFHGVMNEETFTKAIAEARAG
ncbi:DsbA family protein [Pseudaminobacter sp. NGMCC 1.201702]|uniref:DsbA family protein n=1 Tax=Pseudaminobacter sp. NGMCC 1.201702 TaxID=3391825 RepID=UPI0039F0274E